MQQGISERTSFCFFDGHQLPPAQRSLDLQACYLLANSVSGVFGAIFFRRKAEIPGMLQKVAARNPVMELMIFTKCGKRKYLTGREVELFVEYAHNLPLDVRSFCLIIAFTGCRISEALALTAENIDFEAKALIVKCLKKRGKIVYRGIPLPEALLDLLKSLIAQACDPAQRLWPWSRMTGYRRIREVMDRAGIVGEHASPKGLRHGFAVRAIQANVPLTLVQRWLGHADIKTTAIYTSAMGAEERNLAARMWQDEKEPAEPVATPEAPGVTTDAPPPSRPSPARSESSGSAVRYQLQYRPQSVAGGFNAYIPAQGDENAKLSGRRGSKKTLLAHLRDCALVQFWLNCNSKKHVNSNL